VSIRNFQFVIVGILVLVYTYITDAFDSLYEFTRTYASEAGDLIMCLLILGFFLALHFEQMYYETKIDKQRLESERMAQEEKYRALAKIIRVLRHEIYNPLTGVIGNAELLIMDGNLSEKQLDKARTIKREGERIVEIVEKLRHTFDKDSLGQPLTSDGGADLRRKG